MNKKQFFIFYFLFLLLNILDTYTTYDGLKIDNIYETNPIILYLIGRFGFYHAAILKVLLGMACAFILYIPFCSKIPKVSRFAGIGLLFLNFFYCFVVLTNFIVLILYS